MQRLVALPLLCASLAASARPPVLKPAARAGGAATSAADVSVLGNACIAGGAAWQSFSSAGGALVAADGSCLTSSVWPPVDGTELTMAPCAAGAAAQQFTLSPNSTGNAISLVATQAPTFCANLAGYGTSPGTQVWLYKCSPSVCEGNCAWAAAAPRNASGFGAITNPGSGLCLDTGGGPPRPHTCDAGSPSFGLPFCDAALPIAQRVQDLWARLSQSDRIALFSIPIQPNAYNATLNLPSVFWDITCIAGLSPGRMSPQPNVTVFAGTIGQAASFDMDLISRIGTATALEGRIVNQRNYRLTGGTTWQGVLCDGGPLANTAHDPRWGRISETYGECNMLPSACGIAATRALQQRTWPAGSGGLDFLAASQVTRHYIGTHGATDLPHDAEEWLSEQYLQEHQLRVYGAFQRPSGGDAEGVMCAISAIAMSASDTPPPRNNLSSGVRPYVPNCASTFLLQDTLRGAFNSSAFVQSDCCDSISSIPAHNWVATLEEAVADAVNAGLSASYGDPSGITAALEAALASGAIAADVFAARIQRTLLTLFRVGMFDTSSPANPFRGPFDEAQLDGAAHRALARESAARSAVLLRNVGGALPLAALPPRVAVIGPFSNCTELAGGYGGHDADVGGGAGPVRCSHGHSYSGYMSAVATLYGAVLDEAAAGGNGTEVRWAQGSGILVAGTGASGLAAAAAAAAWADLVILAVGLGSLVEVESHDRSSLTLPPPQQALAAAVAAALPAGARLVVALASAGGIDFALPRADAIVQTWYAGEEAGHGLLDVLLGRVSPAARLPLTVHADAYLGVVAPLANFNMRSQAGVGRTYRYINDSALVVHRFGYGLSYCAFAYSGLAVVAAPGGGVAVSVSVATTADARGGAACREVTQVYLALPASPLVNTPLLSLVAFASTPLPPAGAPPTPLTFAVARDDLLTTYANGTRAFAGGVFTFYAGGSQPGDPEAPGNVLAATIEL